MILARYLHKNTYKDLFIINNKTMSGVITQTENGANALSSTGNSFIDFFVMLSRGISTDTITKYMEECWSKDPKKTVAIVFNSRDRQNGKKEKNISNRCMIWLRRKKNNTYCKNILNYINKYGCWKDIIYISIKNPINTYYEIDLIANQLQEDKKNLTENKNISLCAKWASSQQDKNDKQSNTAHLIAEKLFPNDLKKMEKYRKEYLTPLRKRIEIIESKMAANEWNEINYDKVPSIAMKKLNKAFMKHDAERYQQYLDSIKNNEKKIKTAGILPHELVKYYLDNNDYNETIELQWNAILDNVKSQGILKNMLPILDSSGSMYSIEGNGTVAPIYPALALGILISKCVDGPFANKVIAFSKNPSIFEIKGETLYEQVKYIINNLPIGLNTDFEAVFDLIITTGLMFNIKQEQMPESIVCLSDMKFDKASGNKEITNETLHEYIIKKYDSTSYKPPKFIYWNFNSEDDGIFPISTKSENVAMISGFSEQLLKVFMTNIDFNPENIINEILLPYMNDIIIDESDI